jgi:hypothetical protein
VIVITVIAICVPYSDLAGERRYGQLALIQGLVGPLTDRRPEHAAFVAVIAGWGTTFLLALL